MSEPRQPREPRENDFDVDLPGVGKFWYGRRTYGDKLRIRSEYLRLLGVSNDDEEKALHPDVKTRAGIIATHRVLCVSAPAGWDDIESIDILSNPMAESQALDLLLLLREKEDSFRRGASQGGP